MIEILDGIREIANFKEGMHLCLYDNDNVEDYPPHWHAPIEIIMPIENTYRAVCDNVEYMIYPDQILLINSGVIHSLFAPPSGRRLIFQADYTLLHQTRDISNVLATLPSTMLITPESNETAHQQIRMLLLQIRDEYALAIPCSKLQSMQSSSKFSCGSDGNSLSASKAPVQVITPTRNIWKNFWEYVIISANTVQKTSLLKRLQKEPASVNTTSAGSLNTLPMFLFINT